jgi:hypothetical protein
MPTKKESMRKERSKMVIGRCSSATFTPSLFVTLCLKREEEKDESESEGEMDGPLAVHPVIGRTPAVYIWKSAIERAMIK